MGTKRLRVVRDKKIIFLKQHQVIAKEIFELKNKNKELEKLFVKMCKQEGIYSRKTSDTDIIIGMHNIWEQRKEV